MDTDIKTNKNCARFSSQVKSDALRWRPTYGGFIFLRLLFLQPGFQLAFSLRVQERTLKIPYVGKLITTVIWYITSILTSSDCNPAARYGNGLYFAHTTGVIIGSGCRIGDNVSLYQGVTLGRKDFATACYPVVEDGVFVYAGAKVFGPIRIGKNAVIGANAVVTKDVPEDMVAVGVPAKIMSKKNGDVPA